MEFGKAINYNITIEPTDNKGFTAKVGCGIFAFSNKEDLKEAFNEFLDDPKGFEEKYNAEHLDCVTEEAREERPTGRESGSSRPSRGYGVTGHSQSVREVDRGNDQNGMTERDDRGYLR